MAAPKTTHKLLVKLGDGGDPETFGHVCGANSRDISFTNSFDETALLDCDDPLNAAIAVQRSLESQDTQVTLSGRIAKTSLATWRGWADAGDTKNVQILIDEAGADGGGDWTVPAVLSEFNMTVEGKKTIEFTATIMGTGPRVWTAAA